MDSLLFFDFWCLVETIIMHLVGFPRGRDLVKTLGRSLLYLVLVNILILAIWICNVKEEATFLVISLYVNEVCRSGCGAKLGEKVTIAFLYDDVSIFYSLGDQVIALWPGTESMTRGSTASLDEYLRASGEMDTTKLSTSRDDAQ